MTAGEWLLLAGAVGGWAFGWVMWIFAMHAIRQWQDTCTQWGESLDAWADDTAALYPLAKDVMDISESLAQQTQSGVALTIAEQCVLNATVSFIEQYSPASPSLLTDRLGGDGDYGDSSPPEQSP